MFSRDLQNSPSAGIQERRDAVQQTHRFIGNVIACDGAHATVAASIGSIEEAEADLWSVGRLVTILVGKNRVIALTRAMQTSAAQWTEDSSNAFKVELELLGEVRALPDGREQFSTGITTYPYLGARAHQIRSSDLVKIYDRGALETSVIGRLSQDDSIDAAVHVPSMLSKHFALVGSTGSGKSTAVSLLMNKAIESDPKLRILILDPHNEFAAAFPGKAMVIDTDSLDLPFWLFRLEELAEVLYRGRPPIVDELDVLRDLIPEAKRAFRGTEGMSSRRLSERNGVTADTPVPYRFADLMALIDERIGKLDGRSEKPYLRALKLRLAAAINDPRYRFMFSSNTISDTINETISQVFRIPGDGKPIATLQLAGIPSEVVNSVASVLCRMAFEISLWSNGAVHILVVCEEAHRYVPSDPTLGFFPTRQAIARIAKEGRKYGCSLGIITQRPGELDQTILSQCSTIFSMRLSNEIDQDIIRKAIPGSSISAMNFISSLANGEAIAFGEALPVPMRLKFERVKESVLPRAHGAEVKEVIDDPSTINLGNVIERMRQSAGPDISDFQSRVSAAEATVQEAVMGSMQFGTPIDDAPPLQPQAEFSADLEPYNPGMLPGSARTAPLGESMRQDTRIDRYSALFKNSSADNGARSASEDAALYQPSQTLRERLLSKSGSSLLKK
ncbi:ATP-binding protein [Rhizobium sp. LjRoot254]|uniref:ATP-binding protein n=1 Tax=Rhizobium sp. LjRoot254 TaxID=3342297 RepID=UPI003ECE076B